MADYFTQFSCSFDVGSAGNAEAALDLLDAMRDVPDDDAPYGFDAELDPADPAQIIMTDGGQGDPAHVIAFVLRCAEAFDLFRSLGPHLGADLLETAPRRVRRRRAADRPWRAQERRLGRL